MLINEECKMKNCLNISATESPHLTVHWLENEAIAGFRVWQIMFLCFAGVLALIVILCCCIRFRIPRTKQEIEADFIRKKITKKFQKQLRTIQNSDMDEMDLKRALDRIRADFKSDTESLAQSDILSEATLSSENYCRTGESDNKNFNGTNFGKNGNHKGISIKEIISKEPSPTSRFPTLVTAFSKFRKSKKHQDTLG